MKNNTAGVIMLIAQLVFIFAVLVGTGKVSF